MKNLNDKRKKQLTIFGLTALCAVLAFGIYFIAQNPKAQDTPMQVSDEKNDVTPNGIVSTPPDVKVSNIEPTEKLSEPTSNESANNVDLTVIEDKPQAPEKPDTAIDTEKPHDIPTDPTLTNPAKTPTTPATPKPTQPPANTPKNGDTNAQGQVYVEGFGWVTQGGSNVEKEGGSDGDWDKQIGNMD